MTITAEGLRIELLEEAKGTFFDLGDATPSPSGKDLLTRWRRRSASCPIAVSIEGHTDSKPYPGHCRLFQLGAFGRTAPTPRAASCAERGLRPDQVEQVRGFADQHLRNPADPMDPANRRISLIVQYVPRTDRSPAAPTSPPHLKTPAQNADPEKK